MESIRIPYKKDAYGNDILARVSWEPGTAAKPIAIIYHGGGLLVGSSEIIPKAQTEYLVSKNFIVVAPNYRLCPQVTAADSIQDCSEAYDWVVSTLPALLESKGVSLNTRMITTMGHSTGGTLALLIASTKPNLAACTAFYPTLYASDPDTSAHKPWILPAYLANSADWELSTQDLESISRPGIQVSESGLAIPGQVPPARNRWQMGLAQKGLWMKAICPDENYSILEPSFQKLPPTILIQGSKDDAPGSGLDLAKRAEKEGIHLEVVEGVGHMFDMVGNDGPGWESVIKGLDWLDRHVTQGSV